MTKQPSLHELIAKALKEYIKDPTRRDVAATDIVRLLRERKHGR